MIKTYCDRCKKEITGLVCPMSFQCHVVIGKGDSGDYAGGYLDQDRQLTSGRMVNYDLCQKCYNEVASAAVREFHK